ncbi:MAG TPA: hypothetical protein VEW48_11185 [Thermoanaerobaculia bacterium]|nr:hypothetical protein [Thermoanaerobaculia bacterium]
MNDSKHLVGHANLVVKKAAVLPVWDDQTDSAGKQGKRFRTGEVVVRVTVANIGKKIAGPSRTSISLIKAQNADFLDSIETPEIAEGREFDVESRRLTLKEPGAIVILADAPVAAEAKGMVREYGVMTSMKGEMDNAFAFPFDGGEVEDPHEYDNPVVH